MKISVSSLAFTAPSFHNMSDLPGDIGIEIFCEWGSDEYWKKAVPFVMEARTGPLSIHAPFEYIDLSSPDEDEADLFSYLSKPFDLYHALSAESYVVHTNRMLPNDITDKEIALRRKIAEERLLRLDRIAKDAGVMMLVENLGWGVDGKALFDEESFMGLFRRNSELNCIIDVGHAIIEHFDIESVQKELRSRIKAYHLHNNDGLHDTHRHLNDGIYDYEKFARNALLYTPDANLVLECGRSGGMRVVRRDIRFLKSVLCQ